MSQEPDHERALPDGADRGSAPANRGLKQTTLQSPLRYPGGKRRLAAYIAEVLRAHKLRPKLFVEAFAGGASVSIAMLENDLVEAIALADLDDPVAPALS